ncbi:sn-glycerol-3-phosphate ABC transporter ATP-binding protein UgpC [bacterium]|nr:MAG: sn-glycerol-3-phosphate ABC transporter ATP-binding protein UgpC [bacterium]
MASIELRRLGKSFGSVVAVRDVDLKIEDGEFMVFLGPSGCGKTTTLRMVAGLETATSGDILIGDQRVNELSPRERDIAMVFQNYALYPHMSVFENMAFALRMRHVPPEEITRRVNHAADFLGLGKLLERKPRELSGGQRQRVALGRAVVREPAVFLMDEPLSNLDAQLRTQTRTELIRLHRRLGSTVMYVTHDQVEAMTMGHRIVVMNGGSVEQVGTPKEIYDHPRTRFVAQFIGSPPMNFVDCTLRTDNGQHYLWSPAFRHRLDDAQAKCLADAGSERLTAGFRPEDLTLGTPSGNGETAIAAEIDVIETLGSELHVFLVAGESTIVAKMPADAALRQGAGVAAKVAPGKLHVFDRDTGLAQW